MRIHQVPVAILICLSFLACNKDAEYANYDGTNGYRDFAEYWMAKKAALKESGASKGEMKTKLSPFLKSANIQVQIGYTPAAAVVLNGPEKTLPCELGGGGPGTGIVCKVPVNLKYNVGPEMHFPAQCVDSKGNILSWDLGELKVPHAGQGENVIAEISYPHACFEENGARVTVSKRPCEKANIELWSLQGLTTDQVKTRFAECEMLDIEEIRPFEPTDSGLAHLALFTKLKYLYLNGENTFSDGGMQHLAHLSGLIRLDLSMTGVSNSGLAHIVNLSNLEQLDLWQSQIGDAGLEHIAALSNLKRLRLTESQITDAGLEHLAKLTKIEYLDLAATKIGDDGLAHIADFSHLNELNLSRTQVTNASVTHLKKLSNLRSLNLRGTRVTNGAVASIKSALPKCYIHH